jgi:hypothetical protein
MAAPRFLLPGTQFLEKLIFDRGAPQVKYQFFKIISPAV